jgi:hypothetical protein
LEFQLARPSKHIFAAGASPHVSNVTCSIPSPDFYNLNDYEARRMEHATAIAAADSIPDLWAKD